MKIIVTGGAGFLGSRVIRELLRRADEGSLQVEFDRIVSLDLAASKIQDPRVESVVGDIGDVELLRETVGTDTAGVFHLAAILSGGSEVDFDLAMRVNVEATRALLEAARAGGTRPRFVFTSSLAVFGGEMPAVVPETLASMPESTYGSFKAIGELLVNEYSRKGYVDGRVFRLPTISVRPGKPNSAASSFASGILREPLNGEASVLPVPQDTRMWLSSPDSAVTNLVHGFDLAGEQLGSWRTVNVPGISVTVAEMLDALRTVGGEDARALVTEAHDAAVMDIVCSWPGNFDVARPLALGFIKDEQFTDVVRQYRDEFVTGN
ncbi:D-erythronate dehydrogenase [Gulosibacter sp. ACHW.36C]|uniref:SDR family oxidoreductase n=1 Tax=Gulosibacter sediminis TaxID=1729695 RepID=A0ABY4MWB2_9MICO|nr:D-erythronate dehydrogenase [Gulosibacter sediminis]UQN14721.1 SDR family oxidoreductase [Gulosibacter sediminis]